MDSKKWYQSKTIWGIIIAFAGFLLNQFLGVQELNIPENADLATIQKHVEAFKNSGSDLVMIASEAMAALGTFLAIVGRVKADSKITK